MRLLLEKRVLGTPVSWGPEGEEEVEHWQAEGG